VNALLLQFWYLRSVYEDLGAPQNFYRIDKSTQLGYNEKAIMSQLI